MSLDEKAIGRLRGRMMNHGTLSLANDTDVAVVVVTALELDDLTTAASEVGRSRAVEREAVVRFLRHWARLSGAFEENGGRDLLAQFANRVEDGEHLLPPGETFVRDTKRGGQWG